MNDNAWTGQRDPVNCPRNAPEPRPRKPARKPKRLTSRSVGNKHHAMKKTFLFLTAALAVGASLFLAQPAFSQAAYMGKPGTVTASAGAATLDNQSGIVTSEALTTAAAANYTLTLTNNKVTSTAVVFAQVTQGTNTTVGATLWTVAPGSGSVVIVVKNTHASAALNGTLKITYQIYNP